MEKLDWTTHTRGHWEADHCGMCLHVFKSLNGSCWSVYDQEINIDGRGAMVPFEEAKAQAVAAAERWNTQLAAVTAERDAAIEDRDSWRHAEQTFREETEEKEKDAAESLAIVAAQLAALKKRVADAPKAMTYRPNGEGAYIPAVDVADGGTYALLRLEDGE